MVYKLTMQKIWMLKCQSRICLNTAKITEKKAGTLWNYYRDKPINPLSSNSESFR